MRNCGKFSLSGKKVLEYHSEYYTQRELVSRFSSRIKFPLDIAS